MTTGGLVVLALVSVVVAGALLLGMYLSRRAQRAEDAAATGRGEDALEAERGMAHARVEGAGEREKLRLARERLGKGRLRKDPPHP